MMIKENMILGMAVNVVKYLKIVLNINLMNLTF